MVLYRLVSLLDGLCRKHNSDGHWATITSAIIGNRDLTSSQAYEVGIFWESWICQPELNWNKNMICNKKNNFFNTVFHNNLTDFQCLVEIISVLRN